MLGEYKGGLFESLNQVMKLSDEIEGQEPVEIADQVPYGVEVCEKCGNAECTCGEESEESETPNDGAAGYQPDDSDAILGCEKSGLVGEMTTQQIIEEGIVSQVQSIIKGNLEKTEKGNHDPLGFFKEPVKVDMYEPVTKYGDEPLK